MDAIQASDGKIWVFYWGSKVGDPPNATYARSFLFDGWSASQLISDTSLGWTCVPKALEESGVLYVTYCANNGMWRAHSSDSGGTWTNTFIIARGAPADMDFDGALMLKGGTWHFFWAPYNSGADQQWLEVITSPVLTTWSAPRQLTTGAYGANTWWDYWPEAFVEGSNTYLFYSSLQDSTGTSRSDSNIWLMVNP